MLQGKKVVVIMPAYNSAKTLVRTYEEVATQEVVDAIIVVDDDSQDDTVKIAKSLDRVHLIEHPENMGYGANQKTCYKNALDMGADIVIMVHPDYQYTPKLIPAIAGMIANGVYDCVLASRILGSGALEGGMPFWKYLPNRILTLAENLMLHIHVSEYHTGYRGFSRQLLEMLDISRNSDGFVFDNQMLAQVVWNGFAIGEISCPTHYHPEASSVNFKTSLIYGLGCLYTGILFRLSKLGIIDIKMFSQSKKNADDLKVS